MYAYIYIYTQFFSQVVFKGKPPSPEALPAGPDSAGTAAFGNKTLRLMKDATRVLVSPAVAIVRLSTAALHKVCGERENERERKRESVCVYVCVCVREREREEVRDARRERKAL